MDFREQGNNLYKSGNYIDALDCYSKGIANDDILCWSNRSAVWFELGNYSESISDALHVIQNSSDQALVEKNLARKKKAEFFERAKSSSGDWMKLKSKGGLILEKLQVMQLSTSEYFPIGHDCAISALSGDLIQLNSVVEGSLVTYTEDKRNRVELEYFENTDAPFSVLYGGCGDARHFFITLCDLYARLCNEQNVCAAKLDFLLNDINPTVIARIIVVLVELGNFAHTLNEQEIEFDRENERHSEFAGYITMVYCGIGMPEKFHNRLRATLKKCLDDEKLGMSIFPFLSADEKTLESARNVFKSWLKNMDMEVSGVVDYYKVNVGDISMFNLENFKAEAKRMRIAELKKEFDEMSYEKLYSYGVPKGEDVSKAKKMLFNFMKKDIEKQVDEADMGFGKCGVKDVENEWKVLCDCKLMLLPHDYMRHDPILFEKEISKNLQLNDVVKKLRENSENPKLVQAYKSFSQKYFKLNPCLFDFVYWKESVQLELSFDPAELITHYYSTDVLATPKSPKDIFDYIGSIFWKCSVVLKRIESNIRVTFDIGNIMQNTLMYNRKFHRIFLSNIPDYCGLLSAFVACGAQLQSDERFSCFLDCNVLFNTGIWKSYDEYVFSSTMLRGREEVAEILGFEMISGNLFDTCNPRWIIKKDWKVPDRNKLTECLFRLYLGICYPIERDSRSSYFEFSPLTLNAFILTLQFLKKKGVPGHWIAQILQPLLADNVLKSVAIPPVSSPNHLVLTKQAAQITRIDICKHEFANLLSVWKDCEFNFTPEDLPSDLKWFVMPEPLNMKSRYLGIPKSPCLSLMLAPKEEMNQTFSRSYRYDILTHRAAYQNMHIFTSLIRSESKSGMYFLASEKFIEACKKASDRWRLVSLHLDTWETAGIAQSLKEIHPL